METYEKIGRCYMAYEAGCRKFPGTKPCLVYGRVIYNCSDCAFTRTPKKITQTFKVSDERVYIGSQSTIN